MLGLRLAMLTMLDLVLIVLGLWPVCDEKGCRLLLMMRGLRPAALKSAAGDAPDAGPAAQGVAS